MTPPDLTHSRHASNRRWSRCYCRTCRQPIQVRQHRSKDRVEFACAPCGWSWEGGRRFWLNRLRQFTSGLWFGPPTTDPQTGRAVHEAEPVAPEQVTNR